MVAVVRLGAGIAIQPWNERPLRRLAARAHQHTLLAHARRTPVASLAGGQGMPAHPGTRPIAAIGNPNLAGDQVHPHHVTGDHQAGHHAVELRERVTHASCSGA
ncbi:hypothetical protein D3C76_1527320 [compost metagenome]